VNWTATKARRTGSDASAGLKTRPDVMGVEATHARTEKDINFIPGAKGQFENVLQLLASGR
jgi:hypothetical protein